MPRKGQKIKVVSYVHVGDQLVNTEDLDPERRRQLATWLKCTDRKSTRLNSSH